MASGNMSSENAGNTRKSTQFAEDTAHDRQNHSRGAPPATARGGVIGTGAFAVTPPARGRHIPDLEIAVACDREILTVDMLETPADATLWRLRQEQDDLFL
jgi:hypothetical protein